MAETKTNDKADLAYEVGSKIDPSFTEAERDRIARLVDEGSDPIDAAERVLDERVGTNARSIRDRDGDPYPRLESLLPEAKQKARAQRKVEETFGDGPTLSPDAARELADYQRALEELNQLREKSAAQEAELAALREATGDDPEALRRRVAELEAQAEELRTAQASDATPTSDAEQAPPGPAEQTGAQASAQRTIDAKDRKGGGGR